MKRYIGIILLFTLLGIPQFSFSLGGSKITPPKDYSVTVDGPCELNVEVGDEEDPCIVINDLKPFAEKEEKYYKSCSLSKIASAIQEETYGDHYCKFNDGEDARVISFQTSNWPQHATNKIGRAHV